MARTFFSAFLCLFVLNIAAVSQPFQVPEDYQLEKKEDYAHYEKEMIEASKWLFATPFDQEKEKRKEISAFVVKWVSGSPTVNVEIHQVLMDFEMKNAGMLVLFMASCAQYVLENNYSTDLAAKHRYALKKLGEAYKNNTQIKKDKKMEKLIRAQEEGLMQEWLETNFKVAADQPAHYEL